MKTIKRYDQFFLITVFAILTLVLLQTNVRAQCVSLTSAGAASSQNFNTLSNTAGSTTNNLTITGWYLTESGGGARDNEQYAVDTGSSNTGDTYSYGSAGDTERALGGQQSGTLIPIIGACFTNNTGNTINSLSIAYTGEQWRISNTAAARDDRLDFQYSLNATSLTTGTFADVNALDFTNPVKTSATAGALDGNLAANRTTVSSTISSLSVANGATFWIRWTDLNASGADDGMAVDDFSLTPQIVTAAPVSIRGRAMTVSGRGIANARISLVDNAGAVRTAVTSPFGYYRFMDVPPNETFIVSIFAKNSTFTPSVRVLTPLEELSEINFVADN